MPRFFSPCDFLDWQTRIEELHTEVMPRFLHARICYEVKRFKKTMLKHDVQTTS